MNGGKIAGRITLIEETNQVSETFRLRKFVVQVDGPQPQEILCQCINQRCDLLNNFKVNDEVTVSFELHGKPFVKEGKTTYFTTVAVWDIRQ